MQIAVADDVLIRESKIWSCILTGLDGGGSGGGIAADNVVA